MLGQESRRNHRASEFLLNLFHIVVGIVIVVLAVLAFLKPEENMMCFPLIFWLAAGLNLLNGVHKLRYGTREGRRRLSGLFQILFGVLLLLVGAVSALSIWWR